LINLAFLSFLQLLLVQGLQLVLIGLTSTLTSSPLSLSVLPKMNLALQLLSVLLLPPSLPNAALSFAELRLLSGR